MYDVLIKNGTVIDGTGLEKYKADVAIKQDMIYEIGDFRDEEARIELDATGKYISPGYIDVNNHSDVYGQLFLSPHFSGMLCQGVTTILGGNCGVSLAPVLFRQPFFELLSQWNGMSVRNIDWTSMREFLDILERKPLGINFGTLVGYKTIQQNSMRGSKRALGVHGIYATEKFIRDALIEGAFGVSMDMTVTHGNTISSMEMEKIFRILVEFNGICSVHLRDESSEVVESVRELMDVMSGFPAQVHISHLKISGERHWFLQEEALRILHGAVHSGFNVTYDVCPYTITGLPLHSLLSSWIMDGGIHAMLKKINHYSTRMEVIADMKKQKYDYNRIYISSGGFGKNSERKNINDMAADQHVDAEDIVLKSIVASEGNAIAVMDVLNEYNVEQLVSGEIALIASDGFEGEKKIHSRWRLEHPRNVGAFPRALAKYVRERKTVSWEEMIHKMTGFPAQRFGVMKRGVLQEGNYADIVVFDPNKIADNASAEYPSRAPSGIEYVLINGEIAVQSGKASGVLAGKILRK
jgi:N-acyl-D-amino-acid deacylase